MTTKTRRLALWAALISLLFVTICLVKRRSPLAVLSSLKAGCIALSIRLSDPLYAPDSSPPPALLESSKKRPIKTQEAWRVRRQELRSIFEREVFGRAPSRPKDLSFQCLQSDPEALSGAARSKRIAVSFLGQARFHLELFIPKGTAQKPPVFLLIGHRSTPQMDPLYSSFWPVKDLIKAGFATAMFKTSEVDPDFDDGFQNGLHPLFDTKRAEDSWGTLAAWAWAAQRCVDYLVTDPHLDPHKIAIIGHSRGGKTALWAGAQDERIGLVISNNSGCTGAALSRRRKGETLMAINHYFPHWFCDNYKKYNGRESSLPIDQHQLLALIAPRALYVGSAAEDSWADPAGELESCRLASAVYELYGHKGLSHRQAKLNQPLHDGRLAYHQRAGGHELSRYDWQQYQAYARKLWPR